VSQEKETPYSFLSMPLLNIDRF